MLKTLLATAALCTLPMLAFAQAPQAQPVVAAVQLSPINCDALNKGTLICVRNGTQETISKITCSGMFGASPMSIPRGIIHAGETAIVDFEAGKCSSHIAVLMRGGRIFNFDGFDTKNNTVLLVEND